MNNFYLDTNFFIYLADKSSPFHLICKKFIRYCQKENILIATSTETIQEIIHYTKNTKQLPLGLKASKKALSIINELISVTGSTIGLYLGFVSKYKSATSRDLIHLAVGLENKVDKIVTFDRDFAKFKEIKILNPQDITN